MSENENGMKERNQKIANSHSCIHIKSHTFRRLFCLPKLTSQQQRHRNFYIFHFLLFYSVILSFAIAQMIFIRFFFIFSMKTLNMRTFICTDLIKPTNMMYKIYLSFHFTYFLSVESLIDIFIS